MKKCETLLEQRDKLKDATQGKKIVERKKIENQVDTIIEEIRSDIKEMEKELKHQNKKPEKFPDLQTKNKILKLLKQKMDLLKNKFDNSEYNESEYNEKDNEIKTLEQFLSENNGSLNNIGGNRDLIEEEQNKIDEWGRRKKEQDEQLDEIHARVGDLKNEANFANRALSNIGKKVDKVGQHVEETNKSVSTQNGRLKELITKFRSPDKYCCDIILVLLLIGLVCTLYSIIKHKF